MAGVTKFESVLEQALALSDEDRELLAIRIDMNLPKDEGHDEAWAAEIKRRLEEFDRGEADEMDWEDFRKELVEGE
jgi:putative addiction module component (TIGR02574 family)